jgi:hypothetical protein
MEPGSQPGPSIRIGGHVTGQNVVIGSTQTVHGDLSINVGTLPAASEETRKSLQDQIAQLIEALEQVPADRTDDVQDVRLATEDAVAEASKDNPDSDRLRRRGGAIVRTAERLADIAPAVLTLATQVAAAIAAFH